MKILIVDDDKLICFALKTIVEAEKDMEVCGFAHCAEEAVNRYGECKPDITLLDIRMGEQTGIDALKEIKKGDSAAKIIFLTTFLDPEYVKDALEYGSFGYLLKDDFENICPAIRAVYAGQKVFGNKVFDTFSLNEQKTGGGKTDGEYGDNKGKYGENVCEFRDGKITEFTKEKDRGDDLNSREKEVLTLVGEGLNNKEIAGKLFLSEGTVRNYISSMLDKLNLRDRTQLAIYYIKQGENNE